jgi:VWFA-related protein
MRKLSLLFFFTCIALPAFAAKHITVEQLEQVLSTVHDRPDADVARQLSDLELIERLSSVKLAHWISGLSGEDSRHALVALADASADLDPPATEIPAQPAPDLAEQRRMLALTVAYVSKTIPQLPNFFATRQTARFEDTPQLQSSDFFVPYQPLHRVDSSSATVLYRDGMEAVDTGSSKKPPPMTAGLATKGVFGPILATVLLDAAQSKLAWERWEQGPSGPQAVFIYTVPKEQSHYEVTFCCVAEQAATNAANMYPFRRVVGYHGEMAVDPATGTILRLVVEADLKPSDPVVKAAIMVEYGPVEIGGKTYFCPVKSVSKALAQTVQLDPLYKFPLANQLQPLKNSLSDVAFEDYHIFRAEARVLVGEVPDQTPPPAPLGSMDASAAASSTGASPTNENPPETASATATATVPLASSAAPAPAIEEAAAAVPAAAPEPAVPEITVADATTVPDAASNPHPTASATGFTLRTTARLVDVGVVAYDKKGHPVTDLKPEDFEIYDNGRRQEIRFLGQAATESALSHPSGDSATSIAPAQPEYSNNRIPAAEGTTPASDANQTILLIDAANVDWSDLSYARSEVLRFLNSVPPTERVGLYIMHGYSFEVLQEPISDHAQLATVLSHWIPAAQDLSRAQDEEQRNRQHFDWVHSIEDLNSVNGNTNNRENPGLQPKPPPDPKLLIMGSNPGRDALFILTSVARHLAAIPGHKSLVWISSDNVFADWSNQAAARQDRGSKTMEPLAMRTQEALNDSRTSIYPLDASQLEAGGIAADLRNRNVLPVGYGDRAIEFAKALPTDAVPGMKPGRITAQMQQDTHPIQGAFRDLADATGGRAFRRSGSIANELDSVVDDGRATWLLAFTPDQPADDKYHLITVKLNGRRDVTFRYRTGYQYDKEPATMKDRFREAIWQPADVSEVALTANSLPDAKGVTLKLNIAATDLDLAQQSDLWLDKLDIFLVERDDAGLHAQVTGQQLGLRLKPATYQRLLREGVPFEVKVKAQPDIGSIRIVAVDENSGRMGSVTIPAAILAAKP